MVCCRHAQGAAILDRRVSLASSWHDYIVQGFFNYTKAISSLFGTTTATAPSDAGAGHFYAFIIASLGVFVNS